MPDRSNRRPAVLPGVANVRDLQPDRLLPVVRGRGDADTGLDRQLDVGRSRARDDARSRTAVLQRLAGGRRLVELRLGQRNQTTVCTQQRGVVLVERTTTPVSEAIIGPTKDKPPARNSGMRAQSGY